MTKSTGKRKHPTAVEIMEVRELVVIQGMKQKDAAAKLGINIARLRTIFEAGNLEVSLETKKSNYRAARAKQIPAYAPDTTERILELRKQGLKLTDIAIAVGVDINKVKSDLQLYSTYRLTAEQKSINKSTYYSDIKEEVKALKLKGLRDIEVASKLDLKISTVRYISYSVGYVKSADEQTKNRSLGNRSLSDVQEQDIVQARLQTKKTLKALSLSFGVKKSLIKHVLKKHGILLDMKDRQINSQAALIEKYGETFLSDVFRIKAHTPQANSKRSTSLIETWKNKDPSDKEEVSQRMIQWWGTLEPEEKASYVAQRSKTLHEMHKEESLKTLLQMILSRKGELMTPYIGSHKFIVVKCFNGHTWESTANNIQQGRWCPMCVHNGPSKAQLEIEAFVQTLLPELRVGEDRTIIGPKHIDVYVPDLKFGIEFDGLYWHSNTEGRHIDKARRCREVNVKLLCIYEDEWNRADKRAIIEDMIKYRVNKSNAIRLDARKLELERIDRMTPEIRDFFQNNHLSGNTSASFAYVLRHYVEIDLAASVRYKLINNQSFRQLEIARMATNRKYIVRGGASKLLSDLIGVDLFTFSNNRLSEGGVYKSAGFEFVGETQDYEYTDHVVRINRNRCRRLNPPKITQELFDEFPTEREQALGGVFSQRIFGDNRPLYKIEGYGVMGWLRKAIPPKPTR